MIVIGPPGPVVENGGVIPGETEGAGELLKGQHSCANEKWFSYPGVIDEEGVDGDDTDCAPLDVVEGVGPTVLVKPLIIEGIKPGAVVVLGVGVDGGGVVEVVEVRGVLDPIGGTVGRSTE